MGRNADKRRARKTSKAGEDVSAEAELPPPTHARGKNPKGAARPGSADSTASTVTTPHSSVVPKGGVHPSADTDEPPPRVRSLVGDIEVSDSVDGSLVRALFKLTCLLAVRDVRGIPPENMARVAEEVAAIIEADSVSLLRLEPGDDVVPSRLVLVGSHGLAPGDHGLVVFELGDGVAGLVARTGQPVRIEDAPRDPRFQRLYGQRTEIGSLLAVPLTFGGRILGVIAASRREIRAFTNADEDRLHFVAESIGQDLEQARLLFDAVTDPLTGLGSRLSLLLALPREVEMARRHRTELSLIIMDVDGLGAVNQAHGRASGDRFLAEAGRRFREAVRGSDLPVRLGADKLAVLVPMTSANNARGLAKRLMRSLGEPYPGVDVTPTWSVGVATLALADEDALGLVWRCDEAVGAAKADGGDRIVTAPQRRSSINEV